MILVWFALFAFYLFWDGINHNLDSNLGLGMLRQSYQVSVSAQVVVVLDNRQAAIL